MNSSSHILEDFELELQSLRGAVLDMAITAHTMIRAFGKLFDGGTSSDLDLSQEQERELDRSEVRVDEQARMILIRYQPVASDFREVTGALRISSDLEAIGDEAHRIASRHEKLRPWLAYDADEHLTRLWMRSESTLGCAIQAYRDHDVALANDVVSNKQHIVDDSEAMLGGISTPITAVCELAPQFLDAVGAATGLERIARIGTNIAETVVFIETAADVRHNLNPG